MLVGKRDKIITNLRALLLTYLKLDCVGKNLHAQGAIWADVRRLQDTSGGKKREVLPCRSYSVSTLPPHKVVMPLGNVCSRPQVDNHH